MSNIAEMEKTLARLEKKLRTVRRIKEKILQRIVVVKRQIKQEMKNIN